MSTSASDPEEAPASAELCELCEDGVAQLVTWDFKTLYGYPEAVELTYEAPAYSCTKCLGLYTAPGAEAAENARIQQYLETGE